MKKLFLSLVAAIVAATATYAQSSLVATLSHDGVTTAYYGADALKNAYTAAVHGDIITLSPGQFNAVNISKNITLRGAGCGTNGDSLKEPTVISGRFYIISTNDDQTTDYLTIEGIYSNYEIIYRGTLKNARFIKNRFYGLKCDTNENSGDLDNCIFLHCTFSNYVSMGYKGTSSFINCVIHHPYCESNYTSNMECENCIIIYGYGNRETNRASFTNCIFICYDYYLDGFGSRDCVAYNCISNISTIFGGLSSMSSNKTVNIGEVFKDNIEVSYGMDIDMDTYTFELTDEAASTYLGIDGTQVGIYGGDVPFDPTPSNPQITQFDVEKNTANGKLTVKINVE